MASSEIFKTEFKGYNKKQVTEYIMSLNEQMEALRAELDTAESQVTKYIKELDEYKETEAVVKEPDEEQMQQIRDSVRAEIEPVLRKEIASQIEEKYKTVVEQHVREDKEKNEQCRLKAQAYDAQRDMLAEIMIKARADATEICNDAQSRADLLLNETFDKFTKLRSDFDEMKSNVMASKAELDTRIDKVKHYLNDFSQYLEFIERDIENTGDNFKENM